MRTTGSRVKAICSGYRSSVTDEAGKADARMTNASKVRLGLMKFTGISNRSLTDRK